MEGVIGTRPARLWYEAAVDVALPSTQERGLGPVEGSGHAAIGRPYYLARASLDTLVLLAPPPAQDGPEGGSNAL